MLTTRTVGSRSRLGQSRTMTQSLYEPTTTEVVQTEAKGPPVPMQRLA